MGVKRTIAELRAAAKRLTKGGIVEGLRHDDKVRMCALGAFEPRGWEDNAEDRAGDAVHALAIYVDPRSFYHISTVACWSNRIAGKYSPKRATTMVAKTMLRVADKLERELS